MSQTAILVFVGLVFAAVFLLAQGLVIPVFGENRQTSKRLKRRLAEMEFGGEQQGLNSLLREKYLRELSPLARRLESLPILESLSRTIEQSGHPGRRTAARRAPSPRRRRSDWRHGCRRGSSPERSRPSRMRHSRA